MKRYNRQLFLSGIALNILSKFPLLIIAVILGIIGIRVRPLLIAAVCIAAAVILWAVIEQIVIKIAVEHNKDEGFAPFADALTSDDWQEKLEKATDNAKIVNIDIDKDDTDEYNDTER